MTATPAATTDTQFTIDHLAVAIGEQLALLLPRLPEHTWSDVYLRCDYGGLTHATELLTGDIQFPVFRQLHTLRSRSATATEMAHLVMEWQEARLLSITINHQSLDFIQERLSQVVSLTVLNDLIHLLRYYGVSDRKAYDATCERFHQLLASPELI